MLFNVYHTLEPSYRPELGLHMHQGPLRTNHDWEY